MIKASELRIGNLILFDNKPVEVTGIPKTGLNFGKAGFAVSINEFFQPIPLTEEWLVKLGFEKSYHGSKEWSNYDSDNENNICIEFVDNEFYYTGGEGISFSKKFKYVHQLQNLYFAITGEELIIKIQH